MLSKPDCGWSDFQLEGTSVYGLSYLDDIAFEWLTQAIHGLETMLPFCVKGFLEPSRFLCTVSYRNCHIVREDDKRYPLSKEDVVNEVSHTSMLEFCQYLYDDISQYVDEWAYFAPHYDDDDKSEDEKWKEDLLQKLERLKELISERAEHWGEHRCFL